MNGAELRKLLTWGPFGPCQSTFPTTARTKPVKLELMGEGGLPAFVEMPIRCLFHEMTQGSFVPQPEIAYMALLKAFTRKAI